MNRSPSWQSVVIAVAIIALVGLFFAVGVTQTDDTDDFLKIWGAVGTIVGIVAGAIPSYFFKTQADHAAAQADQATTQADQATEAANRHAERVQALAGAADPETVKDAVAMAPEAFEGWKPPET
jgi:hypothetical protein